MSQEEQDRQTLNGYTQRFHVSYEDIRTNRCYLSEEEGRYQSYDRTNLRGKPADPQFMERDLFENINKIHSRNMSDISLSGGYGGIAAVPKYKFDEEIKRYEDVKIRAKELCRKYKEEIYPKEIREYEEALNAIQQGRIQEQLARVRQDDYYKAYFERRKEKEKLRQELADPEWEQLQLEKERKILAIRRRAEAEAGIYANNQQLYEKEKWMKDTMNNRPSIDELYQTVFGKKQSS